MRTLHTSTERFLTDEGASKADGSKKSKQIAQETESGKKKEGQASEPAAAASRDESRGQDKKAKKDDTGGSEKKGKDPQGDVQSASEEGSVGAKRNEESYSKEKQANANDGKNDIQVVSSADNGKKKEADHLIQKAELSGDRGKDGQNIANQSTYASQTHQNDGDQGSTREPKGLVEGTGSHNALWSEEQISLFQVHMSVVPVCYSRA